MVDFEMPTGTVVYAAGNGAVGVAKVDESSPSGGYGEYVQLLHDGGPPPDTVYAHLSRIGVRPFRGGRNVCRYVALGYSGNTGRSTDPHLHFESDAKLGMDPQPAQGEKFTPIWGRRSQDELLQTSDFAAGATIYHDCGAAGCAAETSAYTVDDSQNTEWCESCSSDEFEIYPGLAEWGRTRKPPGFGYGGTHARSALHLETRYTDDDEPVRWASWTPSQLVVDDYWYIYVWIPKFFQKHSEQAAPEAVYEVSYWEQAGSEWHRRTELHTVDQDRHTDTWVLLAKGYATHDAPIAEQLSVKLLSSRPDRMGARCGPDGSCSGRRILADAVLFMPSECN